MEGLCKAQDDMTLQNYYSPNCTLCAVSCRADRREKEGSCGASDSVRIASYTLHHSEEPIISGQNGSGTVFFSHCSLSCIYCQNYPISQNGVGKDYTIEELADIFLNLQERNAHNINLVTPTHYVYHISEAFKSAKKRGLSIPVVYNTSSYENTEITDYLNDFVDVYLADIRYIDDDTAYKYSSVKNYRKTVFGNIRSFIKATNKPVIRNGLIISGTVVRILVLPGMAAAAKEILEFLAESGPENMYVSLMSQYFPYHLAVNTDIDRTLTSEEYDPLIDHAQKLGFRNIFVQYID